MSEPFIAEVKIFAGNFAPRGYAFCNGQILQIAQNTALFSLIGTTYGGNGQTTMGLPNLSGRVAMHAGNGPGLTARSLGETGGAKQVTLNASQMPSHAHQLKASGDDADEEGQKAPEDAVPGVVSNTARLYGSAANLVDMAAAALPANGGGQPHNNMMPYQALNFIIALTGIYPSRD